MDYKTVGIPLIPFVILSEDQKSRCVLCVRVMCVLCKVSEVAGVSLCVKTLWCSWYPRMIFTLLACHFVVGALGEKRS